MALRSTGILSLMRESSLEFVGMSLVEPSIAVAIQRSRREVADLTGNIGLEIAI